MIIYKYPMIELEETRIIKSVEELTVDEIKEQMALFQRLYYLKTKDTPEKLQREKKKVKLVVPEGKRKKNNSLDLKHHPWTNHLTEGNTKKISKMPW